MYVIIQEQYKNINYNMFKVGFCYHEEIKNIYLLKFKLLSSSK